MFGQKNGQTLLLSRGSGLKTLAFMHEREGAAWAGRTTEFTTEAPKNQNFPGDKYTEYACVQSQTACNLRTRAISDRVQYQIACNSQALALTLQFQTRVYLFTRNLMQLQLGQYSKSDTPLTLINTGLKMFKAARGGASEAPPKKCLYQHVTLLYE